MTKTHEKFDIPIIILWANCKMKKLNLKKFKRGRMLYTFVKFMARPLAEFFCLFFFVCVCCSGSAMCTG